MAYTFFEEAILDRKSYGFSAGPEIANSHVELLSGKIAVNVEWAYPRQEYSAPYNRVPGTYRQQLVSLFYNCYGMAHGFRLKDNQDYSVTDQVLATSDGSTDEEIQLIKTYSFATGTATRIIKKPVSGTVTVKEDGVPLVPDDIDTTTGIITINSTVGKEITASFEFDVPVMFNMTKLMTDLENWDSYSTEILLLEDRRA